MKSEMVVDDQSSVVGGRFFAVKLFTIRMKKAFSGTCYVFLQLKFKK